MYVLCPLGAISVSCRVFRLSCCHYFSFNIVQYSANNISIHSYDQPRHAAAVSLHFQFLSKHLQNLKADFLKIFKLQLVFSRSSQIKLIE